MGADLHVDRETLQAVTDSLTEGTNLDVQGDPARFAHEIITWLTANGWRVEREPRA